MTVGATRLMYVGVASLIERMAQPDFDSSAIIPWACPVPFFGEPAGARLATVGINPSNNEFVSAAGGELNLQAQRLPTLKSLQLQSWKHATTKHVRQILIACRRYFDGNPYHRWFGVLERLLLPTGVSFYGKLPSAFHIDIVPWATKKKWGQLGVGERQAILNSCGRSLAHVLQSAQALELIVLNGSSAVRNFETVLGRKLETTIVHEWTLPRSSGPDVPGISYHAIVESIGSHSLGRSITVAGYNHNLQSSYGVSRDVLRSIAGWVAESHAHHRQNV